MKTVISFVIYTRNDTYMGNSNLRLETSINYSANMLNRLNKIDLVEIVIVDWGSEIPLHKVLHLNENAKKIARFILVPLSVTKDACSDTAFPTSIVLNSGIRRARGEFIAQSASDILLPIQMLNSLFEVIDDKNALEVSNRKALFLFRRMHIPFDLAINLNDNYTSEQQQVGDLPVEPLIPYLFGCAGIMMMHRDLWNECQAFDEKLLHWGWNDIDLVLRMRLKYKCIDMGENNYVYHIEHLIAQDSALKKRKTNPKVINPLRVNNGNWGLINLKFEEYPPQKFSNYLDIGETKAKEISDGHYIRKNFLNLFNYFLNNINYKNFKFTINFSIVIISSFFNDRIIKKKSIIP